MWRIVVFLKPPTPGLVKTRIAVDLDPEAAAAIYRVLLEHTLKVVAEAAAEAEGAVEVELRVSPDTAVAELGWAMRPGWRLVGQGDGDLGARLQRATAEALAQGARQVVVVGSDCPGLEAEDFAVATRALTEHAVVVGPAEDGGYWLIGVRAPQPQLFENIPWSTARVLPMTRERLQAAGLSWLELRKRRDIDTLEDWRAWQRNAPK